MIVRVEFFGLARKYAECAAIDVDARTLGEAIERVRFVLPAVGMACFRGRSLQPGYVANINGERFTRDADTPLAPGDNVLILSNDMGG